MGAWLIMALNVSLFGACCFVVADVVTDIGAESLEPAPIDTAATRVESAVDVAAAAPSLILDRNLFGAQLAGETQVTEPVDEPLTATKLPLRLLGTAAASREDRSRAAIEDEKTRKHMVVAVGDQLEGHSRVSVTGIERTRVILDNAGRPEELALDEDGPPRPVVRKRARTARRPARTSANKNNNKMNERLKAMSGKDGKGISDILSSARIVPHYDDGEMQGMKVDAIKAGSIFEKVGLQNGDVITEVNGIVIDRLEATNAIFEEFSSADDFNVAARRGDSPIQMSATAAEIMEQE